MRDEALVAVLEHAHARGHLGPGPVRNHVEHARGFAVRAEAVFGGPPGRIADLGSGGGMPGLVLAVRWPASQVVLIDASARRAADLERAVAELDLAGGVVVVRARAEDVARRAEHREQFDLVTARSFGPPALTAEIGAGLIRPNGWLLVSEPPGGDRERWPTDGLAALGLEPADIGLVAEVGATYAAIRKARPASPDVPRRTKQLVKRPAW